MRAELEKALESSQASDPLLLDFDETLWLRNSTEAYLASLRPRFLAVLILKGLDLFKPWMWLPGEARVHLYRDWMRVVLLSLLLPWSLFSWRRRAATLARAHLNPALEALVRAERGQGRPIWVVSNGFRPIIEPLLEPLAGHLNGLLAAPLVSGFRWRKRGKSVQVSDALGADALARAVVITDNDEDDDLLAACRVGVRRTWPEARYIAATADAYAPFDYMENVKRPGKQHFRRVVLGDDLLVVLLAYVWMIDLPWFGIPALLLLHLSFWAIYEIGYVENDLVAARYEEDPVLSNAFFERRQRFSRRGAWLAALGMGLAGVVLAVASEAGSLTAALPGVSPIGTAGEVVLLFGLWALYLIAVRTLCYFYNHIDKRSRVLPYFGLQAAKFMGFSLLFTLPAAGAALLSAQIVAAWIPYLVYRYSRERGAWSVPIALFRMAMFALIAFLLVTTSPFELVFAGQLALIFLWLAWKGRHDIRTYARSIRWLPQQSRSHEQPEPASNARSVTLTSSVPVEALAVVEGEEPGAARQRIAAS